MIGSCVVMIAMVFAGSHAALALGVLSYATAALVGRFDAAAVRAAVEAPERTVLATTT